MVGIFFAKYSGEVLRNNNNNILMSLAPLTMHPHMQVER